MGNPRLRKHQLSQNSAIAEKNGRDVSFEEDLL